MAGLADRKQIRYRITPGMTISDPGQVKVFEGDREIAVAGISTLGQEAVSGYIETADPLDLRKKYRVEIAGCGEKDVIPTEIFDSVYFAENFHYDGADLGAVIHGETTTFKVWAPTASKVVLNLFAAGDGVEAYQSVEMTLGEKGVWEHTEPCGHGTYYTYTVTTAVGEQEAVDPYAKAAGCERRSGHGGGSCPYRPKRVGERGAENAHWELL